MEKSIYDKMVKRTVLYSFSLWLSLFMVASAWWYYEYWNFQETWLMKDQLREKIENYQKLEKSGLSFAEFKKTDMRSIASDKNLQNIMRIMEKDFYDEYFQNQWNESYDQFISKKIKEIEERAEWDEHQGMKRISSTILPSFTNFWVDFDENTDYSELRFVNYVERIMQTFNLEYTGDIGISDVLPVLDEKPKDTKNETPTDEELLANKIFYVPLSFSLVWNKASIIDFIYFIENVWKVNVDSQNLAIHVDNFFKKWEENYRDSDILLDWEIATSDYNIYLNQMVDIESINFDQYIYDKKEGDKRWEFIANLRKKPQWLEKFEADVTLRFYVKWISDYKLEKKYTDVISQITLSNKDIIKAQSVLSSLKSNQKTPEVALILKRMVTYIQAIKELEASAKTYKALREEDKYDDILRAIELQRLIQNDLDKVSFITKVDVWDAPETSIETNN